MLRTLHIENYALIRETDITFDEGFVAITGETGAGKSILLGALGLLLGQRADSSVLADKERKCIVEAQFDINGLELEPFFTVADVDYDDRLILRREILPSAKSRAFANDTPVQLSFLKDLAPHIIDIHSQHQTLTLSDSTFRLSLLDTLASADSNAENSHKANHISPMAAYTDAYNKYTALKHRMEELTAAEATNRREQDYLLFQFNELSDSKLIVDEQEALEQESQLLAHAETVRESLATASSAIDDDTETSVLGRLRQAKNDIAHIASYHPDAKDLISRLDSTIIELEDINSELQHNANNISFSPDRQQQVDERLALLYRLEKKHGVGSVAELIALRDNIDSRLQSIASLDNQISLLMEQVDNAFAEVQDKADVLTTSRLTAAEKLTQNIIPILHELGMPDAKFRVELTPTPSYNPSGHDTVSFLFNANRGVELRDISRVASGGEMSRLMLAIKSMLISATLLPTIIFDEIDTGVSGDIAGAVGRIMSRMAGRMQVIAITHLPQIAARSTQHLKVYKQNDSDRTISRLRQLSHEERVTELAVMLSADPPTPAAIQTARELMS